MRFRKAPNTGASSILSQECAMEIKSKDARVEEKWSINQLTQK